MSQSMKGHIRNLNLKITKIFFNPNRMGFLMILGTIRSIYSFPLARKNVRFSIRINWRWRNWMSSLCLLIGLLVQSFVGMSELGCINMTNKECSHWHKEILTFLLSVSYSIGTSLRIKDKKIDKLKITLKVLKAKIAGSKTNKQRQRGETCR